MSALLLADGSSVLLLAGGGELLLAEEVLIEPVLTSSAIVRTHVPGQGWRTIPVSSDTVTRIRTETGGWRTGALERGLIRVFKNGMWQTVQYPEV